MLFLGLISTAIFSYYGRQLVTTAKNGNCFFNACARQLIGYALLVASSDDEGALVLREKVWAVLNRERKHYQHKSGLSNDEWDEFMADLRKNGRWRNIDLEIVLSVLASLYSGINFVVYDRQRDTVVPFE